MASHAAVDFAILGGITALAATFAGGYILHTHRVEWLPESGLGILAGAAFSLCALGIDR